MKGKLKCVTMRSTDEKKNFILLKCKNVSNHLNYCDATQYIVCLYLKDFIYCFYFL